MTTHYPKDWIARASAHYAHACEKHPRFADTLLPDYATPTAIKKWLGECRAELGRNGERRRHNALDLLECEVAEAASEIVRGNAARAVEEIYDAVAVLMRMAAMAERGKTLSAERGRRAK